MADETTQTPAAPSHHVQFNSDLKQRIADNNPQVRELLLTDLTTEELVRRKGVIKAVIDKIDAKTKELKKLEGQGTQSFNAQGDKVGDVVFTKDQAESLKKLREELGKLNSALGKALDEGDYQKANDLAK